MRPERIGEIQVMKTEIVQTELLNRIGIDRIHLAMKISSISLEQLKANGIEPSIGRKYTVLNTDNNEDITIDSLDYKKTTNTGGTDDTIYKLSICTHNHQYRLIVEAVLPRILYKDITDTNLYNINTSKDTIYCFRQIRKELNALGIVVEDIVNWKARYFEVNKTVDFTPHNLNHYEYELQWLMNSIRKYPAKTEVSLYSCGLEVERLADTYTISLSNKNKTVLYDKQLQMQNCMNIYVSNNLIRLEVKLNYKQIKDEFNTTNALSILTSKTKLNELYNASVQSIADIINYQIEKDINYYCDLLENNKYGSLLEFYASNNTGSDRTIGLLDIIIIMEAVRLHYKKTGNSHYSRDINSLMTKIDNNHKHNYISLISLLTAFSSKVSLYKFPKPVIKKYIENNEINITAMYGIK